MNTPSVGARKFFKKAAERICEAPLGRATNYRFFGSKGLVANNPAFLSVSQIQCARLLNSSVEVLLNLLQSDARHWRGAAGAIIGKPVAGFGEAHHFVHRAISFGFSFTAKNLFASWHRVAGRQKVG